MRCVEDVFSFMTRSDRCGFEMFVVDVDDEARYGRGVIRLCCM